MDTNEFEYLNPKMLYFDNGATTLKPQSMIEATADYYVNYSASIHRGDYDLSLKAELAYENTRDLVAHLINAKSKREIIFTSGATAGLNMIVQGFFQHLLKERDEIILTLTEHASNILPWYRLSDELGLTIKFIPLNEKNEVTLDALKQVVTNKTKVVSLAHITNTIGDVRNIKEIATYLHAQGIYLVVDAAQSIAHTKIDVLAMDIDFLVFSGHKMYGPTGVGVLYAKLPFLEKMEPLMLGGGMNDEFDETGEYSLKPVPDRFEAGTPNIAGVIGLGKSVEMLLKIGLLKIEGHERDLREYTIAKLKTLPHIVLYNEHNDGHTILFNIKDVFAQDTAIYLNQFGICVRAGNHCAKMMPQVIGVKNTCRITFGIYNTKSQVDFLIKALAKGAEDVYGNVI